MKYPFNILSPKEKQKAMIILFVLIIIVHTMFFIILSNCIHVRRSADHNSHEAYGRSLNEGESLADPDNVQEVRRLRNKNTDSELHNTY